MAASGIADIIDLMLATGARIGEILALRWTDVALDADRPNLTINGTIKTAGQGHLPKAQPEVGLERDDCRPLPDFAVSMLQRRRATASENPNDAVFPTRNGTWQQVNNVER
ncbi:MAG: site-specific integrase, partial [Jiangellaceae bacterium]